jgi:hypothetical protein
MSICRPVYPRIVARRAITIPRACSLLQGGEGWLELAFRARMQDVELEPERTRRLLVHALLNTAASLDAAVPAPTSVADAAHTQDRLQEEEIVALQAGAEDSQNASPRISPSAGPRNSYTVALTSLLPFARERRFRSAAVIARSPIHGRPPLLGFVTPSIGFVTIKGFVTGFVTSSTPKSHPPQ